MHYKDVIEYLCYRDKRSPEYNIEYGLPNNDCSCDNCFYGRNKLANELLKYIKDE